MNAWKLVKLQTSQRRNIASDKWNHALTEKFLG